MLLGAKGRSGQIGNTMGSMSYASGVLSLLLQITVQPVRNLLTSTVIHCRSPSLLHGE